jgi:hypothetical protein
MEVDATTNMNMHKTIFKNYIFYTGRFNFKIFEIFEKLKTKKPGDKPKKKTHLSFLIQNLNFE